jgi:CubicO group peptidase (beta-lactamase class C family)
LPTLTFYWQRMGLLPSIMRAMRSFLSMIRSLMLLRGAALCAMAWLAPLGLALADAAPPADPVSAVDRIFARFQAPGSPGCAVAVSRDGRVLLSRAYGQAHLEHGVPNTPDTRFEVGSVSKQFTAAAVVLLAQQGKLSLDEPVRKYIPELPDYGAPLLIHQMIHHTSGLRDWGTLVGVAGWPRGTRVHTHDHVLDVVSRQKSLNHAPGAEFLYSNTNYNLLAILVSRVSGESFAEFTRKRLFMPLGMTHTEWRDDYTRVVPGRATAYEATADGYHMEMPFENVHGNGGLITTVGDLLLWNENFVHARVGGKAFVSELLRPGRLDAGGRKGREIPYAAGLFLGTYNGVPVVGHPGATAGYRGFLARYPAQRLGLAIACNHADADPEALGREVADVFLAGVAVAPARASQASPVAQSVFTALAGLYRSSRTGEPFRLSAQDGKLQTESGIELLARSATEFQNSTGQLRALFELGADGRPRALRLRNDFDETLYQPVAEFQPSAAELAEYGGEYTNDEAEVSYTVLVQDGRLVMRRRPGVVVPLTPAYRDAFVFDSPPNVALFQRDAGGRVTGFSLGLGRVRDLRFRRQER